MDFNANETRTCSNCGCTDEELFELDGELLCADCMEDKGYTRCADCGEWIPADEAIETANGDYICQDCYDDGYFTCEKCGDVLPIDDAVSINHGELYVCEDCADHYYFCCDDCGDYFTGSEVQTDNYGGVVCDHCYEWNGWCTCDNCGELLRDRNANWDDDAEEYFCDSCWSERPRKHIQSYGYKPTPVFQLRSSEKIKADSVLTFGVELEVDGGCDAENLASDLAEVEQPVYFKHDGSLLDGVEIVSHPASLAYHQYELRWAELTRICKAHGFKSHDAGTCGLHIHIGVDQFGTNWQDRDRVSANLVLIANAIWDELVKFSRRSPEQLHWADRPYLPELDAGLMTDDELTELAIRRTRHNTRYTAVNLMNGNTAELRIFRGTLKRDTLIASIQLANNMAKFAMTHTPSECSKVTFAEVIETEQFQELLAYCTARGLN